MGGNTEKDDTAVTGENLLADSVTEGSPVENENTAYHLDPKISDQLKRNGQGLIAAVVQEHATGEVLMMAWMNDEALAYTLATRKATYWSRSRQELWTKGLTSGHTQYVHELRVDCDGDTVLLKVDQVGAACHTGTHSCFDSDVLLHDADKSDTTVAADYSEPLLEGNRSLEE